MDNQLLKRRVIGATVLVALGVIFIPMILSGGRDEMPLFGSNIPDKPQAIERLKSLAIPQARPIPKNAQIRIPVDEQLPLADIEPKKSSPVVKPESVKASKSRDKAAKLKAWVVQVGSFSRRANALALQKRLRSHQFPAFVEFVKNKDGSVYRVRVGPEVSRAKSEASMQAIQTKLKIEGVVMSHP